jgi:hypothetical protein
MKKYKKSASGYVLIISQEEPEEMDNESEMDESSSDPLSKFASGERYISFSEAGFEEGEVEGKKAFIPSGESLETFSVEDTSNKLVFVVEGKDKYSPVLVDVSNKIVPTDVFDEMKGLSGKDVASHLFKAIISEYSGMECELLSALESLSKEEE